MKLSRGLDVLLRRDFHKGKGAPMRKTYLAATLAALLCLGGGPAPAQQLPSSTVPASETTKPTPRMMIDQIEYDAGEVDPATMITNKFTFKNEGDATLIIERVRAGCGCAVAEADKEVAPGETGQVTVSVRIYREWAGQDIRKVTWVFTNDPLNPQVRLIMIAKVKEAPEGATSPEAGKKK